MNFYMMIHEHRHGVSMYFFKSQEDLSAVPDEEIARRLEIDYTPDSDEYLESMEVSIKDCIQI